MSNSPYRFIDAEVPAQLTPFQVLMKHAELLETGTEGLIEGRVIERVQERSDKADLPLDSALTYSLYLQVPRLRNYLYRLYEVVPRTHNVDYPVLITVFLKSGPDTPRLAKDADELDSILLGFAQSASVGNILANIRNQVLAMEEYQQGNAGGRPDHRL